MSGNARNSSENTAFAAQRTAYYNIQNHGLFFLPLSDDGRRLSVKTSGLKIDNRFLPQKKLHQVRLRLLLRTVTKRGVVKVLRILSVPFASLPAMSLLGEEQPAVFFLRGLMIEGMMKGKRR